MRKTSEKDNVISVLSGFTGDISICRRFKSFLFVKMSLFWNQNVLLPRSSMINYLCSVEIASFCARVVSPL